MRVLYFYPENPMLLNQGNNSRANALLYYFKSRSIEVDLVGVESNDYTYEAIREMHAKKLIHNGYLLKEFNHRKNRLRYSLFYSIPNKILGRPKHFSRIRFKHQSDFDEILKMNKYEFIIISYAYWAGLVTDNPYLKGAKLCIDTHDFLTSQFQKLKGFRLGKYFQKEIEIISRFDKIFVISAEENYLFSQFVKKEVVTVSHLIENKFEVVSENKKFDLIYVASSNLHNIESANWFFNEVFPLLNEGLRMVVIGKICEFIPDLDNVSKLPFVENLDEFYSTSKLAICPVLSGTGLKIKVIEALSFGLPVICNSRGVDGLANKTNNGCMVSDVAKEFASNIELLINNKEVYAEVSNYAKEYFIKHNDKERGYDKIDAIFS